MSLKNRCSVLTDLSLLNLARALKDEDVLIFVLLDIPETTIVTFYEESKALNQKHNAFKQQCLLHWKELRATVKDSKKLKQLDWALRESGQKEIADVVKERNSLDLQITKELFAT
ncbi:unnamed protein product [Schistocephalus solidus]|uniref:DUF4276 family protein n=1 Tax=Schistocephalus solidus TaxID=70667 RepID=A0A183TL84_SCHSO|nr:unnamed protein product [Schistocephalus solidus]